MDHHFEIDLNRCLCIHSMLQLTDVCLQTILYLRGIIPEPYQMMDDNSSPKVQKFKDLYEKITETLKSAFRSVNREVLDEVLIILGNTPFSPTDIFRIDVQPCRLHDDVTEVSSDGVKTTCSEICGVLSPKDRRKIFTKLATGEKAEAAQRNAPKLGKMAKVFISLKTNGKLINLIDGLELDESYEPPEANRIQRLGVRTVRINSKKCSFDEADLTLVNSQQKPTELWHSLSHVMQSLL